MTKSYALLPLVLSLLLFVHPVFALADTVRTISHVDVCFSPEGGCTEAIVHALDGAKSEILVQAYSFTSAPIAQALVRAHKRGIMVQAILDKSQKKERYTSATFLAHAGIPTFVDAAHAIAHNKIMIIDREIAITGSFNFTKAAEERNAENLLVIKSKEMARLYVDNWMKHQKHSVLYERGSLDFKSLSKRRKNTMN